MSDPVVPLFPKYAGEADYEGLALDAEAYLAIGTTQARYELIDGVVVRHPSPTIARQQALGELVLQFVGWRRTAPQAFFCQSIDVKLSDRLVYCADLVAFAPGRFARMPERLETPPDLVGDVLWGWGSHKDPTRRERDFEAFGVREYWVLEGPARVRAQLLGAAREERLVEHGVIESLALPGLCVDLERLREFGAE